MKNYPTFVRGPGDFRVPAPHLLSRNRTTLPNWAYLSQSDSPFYTKVSCLHKKVADIFLQSRSCLPPSWFAYNCRNGKAGAIRISDIKLPFWIWRNEAGNSKAARWPTFAGENPCNLIFIGFGKIPTTTEIFSPALERKKVERPAT